jgi:hypothetical protein
VKVKCRFCNLKDTEREEMVKITNESPKGKTINMYYHNHCYPEKLKQDEENKEKDYLYDVIKEVHQIKQPDIPKFFWIKINELRHGSVYIGRNTKKRYKEGFSFNVIAETYKFCRETIEYYKKTKDFKDLSQELNYCYTIICDKIGVVQKKNAKKEFIKAKKEAEEKEQQENSVVTHTEKEVKYKKQKREDDLSDFL